jgi:hypothetical protein
MQQRRPGKRQPGDKESPEKNKQRSFPARGEGACLQRGMGALSINGLSLPVQREMPPPCSPLSVSEEWFSRRPAQACPAPDAPEIDWWG